MDNLIFINKPLPILPAENDEGNREYKYRLTMFSQTKEERFVSQMKYRLYEGKGKALYIIGIKDDGTPIGLNRDELIDTLEIFKSLANKINVKINNIRIYGGIEGDVATLRIYTDNINIIEQIECYDL